VTVPGACAAWCDTVAKHGWLSMQQILSPAIHLAEIGVAVQETVVEVLEFVL
jgi:gamma-glutamyltranspeptidase/glutathione hydrolase